MATTTQKQRGSVYVPKTKRSNKSDVEVIREGGRAGEALADYFAKHGTLPVSK